MKDRIKFLRKNLGLTQEEFSSRIGIKRNTLAGYETGKAVPSDAIIMSICKEYRVNEEWLRNGTGDMRPIDLAEEIEKVVVKYNLDDDESRLIKNFVELDSDARKRILAYMKAFVSLYHKSE